MGGPNGIGSGNNTMPLVSQSGIGNVGNIGGIQPGVSVQPQGAPPGTGPQAPAHNAPACRKRTLQRL